MRYPKELQQRIQSVGELVAEVERTADPAAKAASKNLVQLLMEMHAAAMERMMELVFQLGDPGERTIDKFGSDPLVSSLLVLHGLHPDDLEARVVRAVEQLRPQIRKQGAELELAGIAESSVRLKVRIEGHACGSTAKTIQSKIEGAIYDAAPDVTSLSIEGLEEPAASGFVALDKLMTATVPAPVLSGAAVNEADGAARGD
jgi:Fe-S cluster biogenesis protein NfuA